jgi:hypothetical protein
MRNIDQIPQRQIPEHELFIITAMTTATLTGNTDALEIETGLTARFHKNVCMNSHKPVLFLGYEFLTWVIMKSSIFWDITLCSPLKVN